MFDQLTNHVPMHNIHPYLALRSQKVHLHRWTVPTKTDGRTLIDVYAVRAYSFFFYPLEDSG